MKKIERLLAIIVLLLENDILSTTQLAERFDVSKRTIFRDIQTIENAGFPILSVSGRTGGFSLMRPFKLRTLTYNNEEKRELLSALQVSEELLGTVNHKSVIKEKINLMYTEAAEAQALISAKSPTIHRTEIEGSIHEKVTLINAAMKREKEIKIIYVDNKGIFTEREVQPYEAVLFNGSWYLYAYCTVRKAFRFFKLTRIRKIEALARTFERIEEKNRDWLHTEELFIELRFRRESLGLLYDYYLEEEMIIGKKYIHVGFHSKNLHTLLPLLLTFGNKVQVLQPAALREQHQQCIRDLAETYKE